MQSSWVKLLLTVPCYSIEMSILGSREQYCSEYPIPKDMVDFVLMDFCSSQDCGQVIRQKWRMVSNGPAAAHVNAYLSYQLFHSRLLLDANACRFANNVNKVVSHHKVRPGGDMEIWDIEDLIELGRANSGMCECEGKAIVCSLWALGCPYFASRTMADSADLIFCPYNYILEPCKDYTIMLWFYVYIDYPCLCYYYTAIRKAMNIDLEGSIVILDEGDYH